MDTISGKVVFARTSPGSLSSNHIERVLIFDGGIPYLVFEYLLDEKDGWRPEGPIEQNVELVAACVKSLVDRLEPDE